jgi:uncharacterized protein YjbI with pentapeptide repeats
MTEGILRTPPRADRDALKAVEDYRAALERGEYRRLKLAAADLRDVDFSGLQLDECDLTGAILDGATFVGASLVRADLAGASLLGADFSFADLDRADLEAVDATAAAFINANLSRVNLARSRLKRADLAEANLKKANLFESDLTGANLSGAFASQANLHGVILEDTVLTGLRGEPFFDAPSGRDMPGKVFGWPAVRLAEPQLVHLAVTYLTARGWGVIEPSLSQDTAIDLIARRGDTLLLLEVKATATPSHSTFTHMAKRLRNSAAPYGNAVMFLVIPGPVPESLRDLATANRIGVLGVWIDSGNDSIRVEEIVRPAFLPAYLCSLKRCSD